MQALKLELLTKRKSSIVNSNTTSKLKHAQDNRLFYKGCARVFSINTTYTCILYLYRECFAEAIGEVTKREMKLCWVGGEVSSTVFTESFLTFCGETEHSELLACEGVRGVTVCVLVSDSVHACL